MDLMRARIALRERPLLDIVDLAVRFSAAHAAPFAKLSLVVLVPGFIASCAAGELWGWWASWVAAVVLGSFATAPFVALASRLVFADDVRAREAVVLALRAVPRLAGARAVQLLALAASALLSGLPWLWAGTTMLFVVEVSVLERAGVGASLGRAHRIASAHFGTALLAMVLLGLAPLAAAMLFDHLIVQHRAQVGARHPVEMIAHVGILIGLAVVLVIGHGFSLSSPTGRGPDA